MCRSLSILLCLVAFVLTPVETRAMVQDLPPAPRALVIGDSNIYGHLGKYLQSSLQALGFKVIREGRPTSGLARPDFYDWTIRADQLIDEHEPHVVVMMFGGNDGQRIEPGDPSWERVHWKEEVGWREAYAERVYILADLLRGEGRRVFLLSPTNRRSPSARAKCDRIRQVQERAVRGMERVTWIDMWPLSSDTHGRFLDRSVNAFGDKVTYRRSDGIHLTQPGGVRVGRQLVDRLVSEGLLASGDASERGPMSPPPPTIAGAYTPFW
ncbi:MAG: DUF459 domain-containing protein [Myxococcota bacterium]|nr:DUF459 domain-containing protein [Myxococcota bacterium]